jgi:hypothetical protein
LVPGSGQQAGIQLKGLRTRPVVVRLRRGRAERRVRQFDDRGELLAPLLLEKGTVLGEPP